MAAAAFVVAAAAISFVQTGTILRKGQQEEVDALDAARVEQDKANIETDARLQRTAELRSAQRVSQAAAGLAFSSGSFRAVSLDRERNLSIEQGFAEGVTARNVARLRSQAKAAIRRSRTKAFTNLLGNLSKTQSGGGFAKGGAAAKAASSNGGGGSSIDFVRARTAQSPGSGSRIR